MEKIQEWNEHVGISWCKEGRINLNKVIRKYNKWIDKHSENIVKTAKLLNKVEENLEMQYRNQSGDSGWKDELLNMKKIVIEQLSVILNDNNNKNGFVELSCDDCGNDIG